MTKITPVASGIIAITIVAGTISLHVQDPLIDHDEPVQIPIAASQSTSNTFSVPLSTNFITVQDAVTEIEYDATPLKKAESSQGG